MHTFIIVLVVILVVIYVCQKAYFEYFSDSEPVKILVFTSGHCGHCHTYKREMEQKIKDWANSNGCDYDNQDGSSSLARDLDVQYVPTAFVYKGDNKKQLEGPITIDNLKRIINSM